MSINIKPSHKGRLHAATHTPAGQPISQVKLEKAERSTNANVRREATFAENAKHWNHKGKK